MVSWSKTSQTKDRLWRQAFGHSLQGVYLSLQKKLPVDVGFFLFVYSTFTSRLLQYFFDSFNKQNFRFVETEALGSIMEYTGDLFTSGNNDHCIELWCSHMCTSVTYLALSFSSSKSSWLDS